MASFEIDDPKVGDFLPGHVDRSGADVTEHIAATHMYADYDALLRGYEMASRLIAPEADPAPVLDDPSSDFWPLVRSGRRAPHVWVDDAQTESVLDWFGNGYVLLLGPTADPGAWTSAVSQLPGAPIEVRQLPVGRPIAPYVDDAVVLVRPDGLIAYQTSGLAPAAAINQLRPILP